VGCSPTKRSQPVKITDVRVTRYRESLQAQAGAEVQIVDVHTDDGVTGLALLSLGVCIIKGKAGVCASCEAPRRGGG
jgi:hypothetical protein